MNFIAFSVVSVVVTAGTFNVYGEYIYDPVEIVGRIDSIWALLLGAVTFAVATLGINVVANFVSPAYDPSNVWPSGIDFRRVDAGSPDTLNQGTGLAPFFGVGGLIGALLTAASEKSAT